MKKILEYSLKCKKSSCKMLQLAGNLLWKIVGIYVKRQEKLVEQEVAESLVIVPDLEKMLKKIRENENA